MHTEWRVAVTVLGVYVALSDLQSGNDVGFHMCLFTISENMVQYASHSTLLGH